MSAITKLKYDKIYTASYNYFFNSTTLLYVWLLGYHLWRRDLVGLVVDRFFNSRCALVWLILSCNPLTMWTSVPVNMFCPYFLVLFSGGPTAVPPIN